MRRAYLMVHLWAGMIAALFLLALGVSGSIVAFENEIDRALNPKLTWIEPGAKRLTLAQMAAKLEAAYPGSAVMAIGLSDRDDVAWNALLTSRAGNRAVAFNPYTGAVLGDESQRNDFVGKVHQFHLRLLAGRAGGNVVTAAAVLLLVQAITGIVLWWPRKLFTFGWRRSWRALNLDVHQVLGLYTSAFLIVFALTALVIHWDDDAPRWINRLTGSANEPRFPQIRPLSPDKPAPDFDAVLAAAQAAEPDAHATGLFLGSNPVRIAMRHPEDHTPAGRTNVFVDAYTGKIIMIVDSRKASPGFRLVKLWNREVHTGDIGGLPTRILACAISLSLPILVVTGPLIWWNRRRRVVPAK
ncbi:MAG TPA: PepSY-associated TM helix domain-containing protein [Acidobacteriaceae bacterium]|nr:PepSY-associated TM helix domain-containing protein [Acidobacteriaceae bacterium]